MKKTRLNIAKAKAEDDASSECQDKIIIQRVNARDVVNNWKSDGIPYYSLLMITAGSLAVEYNRRAMDISAGELYLYAPGMPTRIVGASDDYQAYLLMIEERTVVAYPMLSLFLKTAYLPVAEFKYPKIHLTSKHSDVLSTLFTSLLQHAGHMTTNQEEAVVRLCEVIAIDVSDILHQQIAYHRVSSKSETLFARFLGLVPRHAAKHHDLKFYADKLNISTTYLSRVVRRISGRTVMSFVEYAIMNEAIRLLKNTDEGIAEIAFQLNFSDQSSFSKFFTRKKKMSPLSFRKLQM